MTRIFKASFFIFLLLTGFQSNGQAKKPVVPVSANSDSIKNISMAGLKFRSIGPAVTGGRIVDIAVNPANTSEYFVASGHGFLVEDHK
jgi:hypothetical protein